VNHTALFARLRRYGLNHWAQKLESESVNWLVNHGDYARWSAAVESLPTLEDIDARFDSAAVTIDATCTDSESLHQSLRGLIPWRKGPYNIAGVTIDCEWRSDFKWDRVLPHLAELQGRRILDVGCGNGYHC
jgi:tRNA (mo5U34)-methyltransferase